MNGDGSEQRQMTTNPEGDYNYPSLAPDGNSLLYAGFEGQGFEIYEMDLQGNARQLTQGLGGNALAPEISPDGQSIVFTLNTAGQNAIWIMNRDGSSPHQVIGPPEVQGWDPSWSADGSLILFASNLAGNVQLFSMRPDGSDRRQVSNLTDVVGRSDWSPDGSLISTYAGPSWDREIYLIPQNGALPYPITDGGNNLAPGFSPDGQWIVYTSYLDNFRDVNGCEIYIMRIDGTQITRLTNNAYCDWQPRWGP
jgi:TolB protein